MMEGMTEGQGKSSIAQLFQSGAITNEKKLQQRNGFGMVKQTLNDIF